MYRFETNKNKNQMPTTQVQVENDYKNSVNEICVYYVKYTNKLKPSTISKKTGYGKKDAEAVIIETNNGDI